MNNNATFAEEKQGTLTDEEIELLERLIGFESSCRARSINDEAEKCWVEEARKGSYRHN